MYLASVNLSYYAPTQFYHDHGRWCCGEVLQGAEEEVARVIVGQGNEWVAIGMQPANANVLNGEELLAIAVEEDDRC